MSDLFSESTTVESIVKFIREAGPTPPGPVPPGPTPGPTPVPDPGSWVAGTGDALLMLILALLAIASIGFFMFCFTRRKAIVEGGEVFGGPLSFLNKKTKSKFLLVVSAILLAITTIFCTLYISSHADQASAYGSAENSLSVETKPVTVHVYDDGIVYDSSYVKNNNNFEVSIKSVIANSSLSEISDVVWTVTAEGVATPIFTGVANPTEPSKCDVGIGAYVSKTIGLSSNISYDLANKIATEAGTEVLKITYTVEGEQPVPPPPVGGNLLANAPNTTEYGLLEDRFYYETYNPLLATAVEFKDISEVDVTKARNAGSPADLSNDQDKSVLGYVMDDQVANSYKLTIVANGKIKANTTSLSRMFKGFRNLYSIDYSNLDTSIAKDASYMFENAGRDDGVMCELSFSTLKSNGQFSFADGCDLSHMFDGCNASVDVSALNTNNVVNMDYMFHNYCKAIATAGKAKVMPTLKLANSEGGFKIPAGCSTYHMFDGCAFDLTPKDGTNVLDQIDFSSVTDFSGMFKDYCTGQEGKVLDLTGVDMSNASSMDEMFEGAFKGAYDSVIIFPDDFKLASDVSSMFKDSTMTELDLSNADFSQVTNMSHFFDGYGHKDFLYEDVVVWPEDMTTADDCDASYMFANSALYPDVLEKWDPSKISNMEGFFYNYGKTIAGEILFDDCWTISFPEGYKVAKGCSLAKMFQQAYCSADLSNLDASEVTDFSHMFDSFGSVIVVNSDTGELSAECELEFGDDFKTGKGSNFSHMFEAVQLLNLDLSKFDMNNGIDFSYMFRMVGQNLNPVVLIEEPIFTCRITFPKTVKPEPETSFFNAEVPVSMDYMFAGFRFRTEVEADYALDVSMFDFENVTSMVNMFSDYCNFSLLGSGVSEKGAKANLILPKIIKTAEGADVSYMFSRSNAFNEAKLPEYHLNIHIANAGNISHMFDSAFSDPCSDEFKEKATFVINVNFDSGKEDKQISDMSYMFNNAFYSVKDVGHGRLVIGKTSAKDGANASHMFDGVKVTGSVPIQSIDFSNFGDLSYCFANLGTENRPVQILGIDEIVLKKVTNLEGLFYNSYIRNIVETGVLDLTKWDVSNVVDMSYLFYGLKCAKLNISTWKPSACTNMEGMFKEFGINTFMKAGVKSQIIFPDGKTSTNKWTTGENCSMKFMFEMCLADVDLTGFDVSKVTNMEGMFLGFGTTTEQIEQGIQFIIENIFSNSTGNFANDKEALDFYALFENLVAKSVDDVAGQYLDDTAYASSLTADAKSALAERSLSTALSTIQNQRLEAGDGGIASVNSGFDGASVGNTYNDALASADVDGEHYANDVASYANGVKGESARDIANALTEVLNQIDLNKYQGLINEALQRTAEPNLVGEVYKIVFNETKDSFKPGTETNPCSMKAMFAFSNVLNSHQFSGEEITGYEHSFKGFNTSNVNDMSFMFAGYYFVSTFSGDIKNKLMLDISTFDTAKVTSMAGMFMLTGIMEGSGGIYPKINIIFGENFMINSFGDSLFETKSCCVAFMFTFCFATTQNLNLINTSNATNLAYMFTFSNIPAINIGGWDTSNVKNMRYMFAFHGLIGTILDKLIMKKMRSSFRLNIGAPLKKFEIGADVDVTRMFMLPGYSELDLTNVETKYATNLSRMFEMCIMYNWIIQRIDEGIPVGCGINILSWETPKVKNFNLMFAFTIAQDIQLPASKLKTADGATMIGMFMYTNLDHLASNEYSEKALSYDVSRIDFSNVTSTACMFKGFDLLGLLIYMGEEYHYGSSLNFGTQTFKKCEDMSSMFELCSLGIDLSGVKVIGLKNANRMFAFSGYTYLPIDRLIPGKVAIKTLLLQILESLGAYYTEIKLPKDNLSFKTVAGSTTADFMFLGAKSGNLEMGEPLISEGANKGIKGYSIVPSKIDIGFMQTENIKSMEGMFMLYTGSVDMSNFNGKSCVNAKRLFSCYGILNLTNIRKYTKSKITKLTIMDIFAEVTWPSKLKWNSDCRLDYMFSQYLARPNKTNTGYGYDFSFMDVSDLKRFDYLFAYGFGLFNYDLSSWDMSSATSLNHMFQGHGLLATTILDVVMWRINPSPDLIRNIIAVLEQFPIDKMKFMTLPGAGSGSESINMVGMFSWATFFAIKGDSLTATITLDKTFDLQDWNFSNVENASYAFAGYGLGFLSGASLIYDIRDIIMDFDLDANITEGNNLHRYFKGTFADLLFSTNGVKFADGARLDGMFALADCNVDLAALDTSNVASLEAMFAGFAPSFSNTADNDERYYFFDQDARKLKLNIPNNLTFNYPGGVSLNEMFMFYHPDTLDVSNWDTSNVKSMTRTFAYSKIDTLDVYKWDTSSCTTMIQTFAGSTTNCVDMSEWDFSKVTNMDMMFAWFGNTDGCSIVYFPVTGMVTAPGCVADAMFMHNRLTSILLYGLNIENISSVDYMFAYSEKLQTIHVSDSVDWTGKKLAGTYMFLECNNLKGAKGTTYMKYHTNIEFARTDKGTDAPGYFSATHSLREPSAWPLASYDSEYQSIFLEDPDNNYEGFSATKLKSVTEVEFKTGDVSNIKEDEDNIDISWSNDGSIFACLKKNVITVISEGTVYSRQKSLVSMFNWENSSLKTVTFEPGMFDTVAADSTYSMFEGCTYLKYVDMHTINTSNVVSMRNMFRNTANSYLSSESDEGGCVDFVILSDPYDLSSYSTMFNTSHVVDMSHMFEGANLYSSWIDDSMQPLNLVTFNVTNVTDMSFMFANFLRESIKFPVDEASFSPKEGCSFVYMFSSARVKYLDLSGFKIKKDSKLDYMFNNSSRLRTIYVGADFNDTNDWSKVENTSSYNMFYACSVEGDEGSRPSKRDCDITHARPDRSEDWDEGFFSTSVKLDMEDFDIDLTKYVDVGEVNISFVKDYSLETVSAQKAYSIVAYMAPESPIVVYCMIQNDSEKPHTDIIFSSNQDFIPCDKDDEDPDDDVYTCESMFTKGLFDPVAAKITNITFDNIDFSYTVSTKQMFAKLENLTKIYFYNAKGDLSYVYDASEMFMGCQKLTTVDVTYWNLGSNADITRMFAGCQSLKTIYANKETDWRKNKCTGTVFDGCDSILGNGKWTIKDGGPTIDNAWVSDGSRPGYFTYGALLMNYNEETDQGILEYAMEQYYQNHPISFIGRVSHDLAEWYQKQLVSSVDFYMDFEINNDYKLYQQAISWNKAQKVDISYYRDQSVFAYIYAYKIIDSSYLPPALQNIPILKDLSISLFRVAISTPHENAGKQIIADTESLKYMFRGFNFFDWANICEGWGGVNFSRDVSPNDFEVFNTSAARSAKGMFMDTYSFGVAEHFEYDSPDIDHHSVLDLTGLDTSSVNDFSYMFWHCQVGELVLSTAINDGDTETSKFSFANASNLSHMFESFGRLTIASWDKIEDKTAQFLIDFPSKLYLPEDLKTNTMADASYMFYFSHIMDMDLRRMNFDNFYNMDGMFSFAGAFRFTLADYEEGNDGLIPYQSLQEFAKDIADGNAQKCEEWLMNYYNQTDFEFGNGFCSILTFPQEGEWGPKVACTANEMFRGSTFSRIYADRFNTGQITSMRAMFQLMPFVQYIFVQNKNVADKVYWNTENVTDMSEMFSYCGSIDGTSKFGVFGPGADPKEPGDFPVFTFKKDCKVGRMFERCHIPVNLEKCKTASGAQFGLNNIRDYTDMFYEYAYYALPTLLGGHPENLTVKLCSNESITNWKPLENASMYQMFRGCKANIDLSKLDTSTVNDFGGMFMSFGNGDVEDLYDNVGITFPKTFATASNADMSRMFKGYKGFGYAGDWTMAPDFTTFNTSKVVNMSEMFRGCKLHSLDLNTWDTSNVRDFSYMFSSELLRESYVETITLGKGFVVDEAVDLTCMFGSDLVDNDVLRTIECPNDWASVIDQRLKTEVVWTDSMFAGCYKLVGNAKSNPTTYDVDYLKHTLARPGYVDASGVHRGYFTDYTYKPTNEADAQAKQQENKVVDAQNDAATDSQLDAGAVKELKDSETFKAFKDGFVQSASEFAEPLAGVVFNFVSFISDLYFMLFVA